MSQQWARTHPTWVARAIRLARFAQLLPPIMMRLGLTADAVFHQLSQVRDFVALLTHLVAELFHQADQLRHRLGHGI